MCGGPRQGWGGDVLAERERAPARKVPDSLRAVRHSLCCVEGTKTRREACRERSQIQNKCQTEEIWGALGAWNENT